MISGRIEESLNALINKEIYSAYFYLAMGAYAVSFGFNGFVDWFNVRVREELRHARKIHDYIHRQGGGIDLNVIDEPPRNFSGIQDVFEKILRHERKITKSINELLDLSLREKDCITEAFLREIKREQLKEETNCLEISNKLRKGENNNVRTQAYL